MVKVPNRERSFGISVGAVLCGIAVLLVWRGRVGRAEVLGAIGATLLILGRLRPALLKMPRAMRGGRWPARSAGSTPA